MKTKAVSGLVGGTLVLGLLGCGADAQDPGDGTGGAGSGAATATTKAEFTKNFYNIVCGADNTSGALPGACGVSNDDAVNLYDCLWKAADFDNDGSLAPISADRRAQLSSGAHALCSEMNTPAGYTCYDLIQTSFGNGTVSRPGNIWDNTNPKPTNAKALAAACGITLP